MDRHATFGDVAKNASIAIVEVHVSQVLDSLAIMRAWVGLLGNSIFPSWPVGLMLLAGVASAFAAIYWFLFEVWIGATPGRTLAEFAIAGGHADDNDEDRPRFR